MATSAPPPLRRGGARWERGRPRRPVRLEWRGLTATAPREAEAAVQGLAWTSGPEPLHPGASHIKAPGGSRSALREFAGADQMVGDVAELPVGVHRGLGQRLERLIGGQPVPFHE